MKSVVVDTNVLLVANGRAEQADDECVLASIDALERVQDRQRIILDSQMEILDEYKRKCSLAGQPGVGDAFFKWVWSNQATTSRCERVEIHPRGTSGDDFEEFPNDPALEDFDPDDRKFVAVALASQYDPKILNSVDSDWWQFRASLTRHGVKIQFLCTNMFEGIS